MSKKTWKKQFMKPKNFRDCGGPWCLWHLGFFTNHLKLVNSIPVNYVEIKCPLSTFLCRNICMKENSSTNSAVSYGSKFVWIVDLSRLCSK